MNIIKSRWAKLLGTFFVMLLLTVPALCQSGPPAPPPDPTLGAYYFEDTNWLSLDGDAPLGFSNLVSYPLWSRNALLLDTTNETPAYLNYDIIETNDGSSNLDFSTGAIKFSFISDWATADTNQNGDGPGDWAFLIGAGDLSSGSPDGHWAVYIDAGGSNIYFGGVSNSVSTVFVSAPISWASNSIHLVGIEYTSSNSTMYLDGQFAASGAPVTIVPATNVWTNGFFIGSDAAGYEQAQGIFWYMEFFNSNFFNTNWSDIFNDSYFTNGWLNLSNNFTTWLAAQGGGFSFESSGGFSLPPDPTNTVNTNYAGITPISGSTVSNVSTNVNIRMVNTLSNVTYEVLTNKNLSNTNGWGIWRTFLASNSITPMPSISLSSNALFFQGVMVGSTGTNSLPDWWCLEYFGTLNVNPYADPDGDGLCNMDEYVLRTNPTNAQFDFQLCIPMHKPCCCQAIQTTIRTRHYQLSRYQRLRTRTQFS